MPNMPNAKQRKWTEEDRAAMREALRNGKTLQEIGSELGVSRQRVAQIVGAVRPMKEWNRTYSIYPAIDSWMKFHRVTYAQLTEMLGYSPSASSQAIVAKRLMGDAEFYKSLIDSLLRVTGMTYEEAFRKE